MRAVIHRRLAASALSAAVLAAAVLAVLAVSPVSAREAGKAADRAAAPPETVPAQARPQLPEVPRTAPRDPAEIAFNMRLDGALAPLRDLSVSPEDAAALKEAFKAVVAGNLEQAVEARNRLSDPLARKLVDWYRLRSGKSDLAETRAFAEANPTWPDLALMLARSDEALFAQGASADAVKAHFKGREPRTGAGMAALASALLAQGDAAGARTLAAKAWREETIPAGIETAFVERFRAHLTAADHKWRLDRLLIDDVRWTADRNERAAIARRTIALLPEAEQKKANARLAVFLHASNAPALLAALPAESGQDWGLLFHRAQQARLSKQADEAARLLLTAPTDAASLVNPDGWWLERRAAAYAALNSGKNRLAFDLVKSAGPLTVNPLKEQTFMAGWIALRLLKDAKLAEPHLVALKKAADGPLSRAKSAYWLGRSAEARGDAAAAREHYKVAGAEGDTFHGLLARQKLEPGKRTLDLKPPAAASDEEIARFVKMDAVRAAVIARKAGLDLGLMRNFLFHIRSVLESEAHGALVAHLANGLNDPQTAVRLGKAGIARGQNLVTYAYPLNAFPAYRPLRQPPEPAYLLSIARQETEFHPTTVSGAGAKGLLQVMNVTAAHVCKDYKIKCEIPRLLTDTSYNTMIASAYIADRMDEFAGSYVLTLAGYNAGPGRARQWVRQFGDPRDPKVDPIDWIERIPFQETREYVSKVLANVQLFRARLGESEPLRLDKDLLRARGAAAVPVQSRSRPSDDAPGTATAGSDG